MQACVTGIRVTCWAARLRAVSRGTEKTSSEGLKTTCSTDLRRAGSGAAVQACVTGTVLSC